MNVKITPNALTKYNLVIIFSILFANIAYSQNQNKDIKSGLELCYNFKWEKAESIFQEMTVNEPENPNGYYFLTGIYLWYYLGSHEKEDFNKFVSYSDDMIEAANSQLEDHSKSAYLNYILGSNYMYRSIAFTKEENYLDAVWASKKSETYLKTVLEIDPKFTDAYLGLGLYNFAVGQIPAAFQWALSLAGIKGDKQTGIDFIKKAATHGNLAKVEAQYYLSQILSEVLLEREAALYYLKNLIRKYPDNLLFSYSYAVLEIKEHNLRTAENVLSKIVKLQKSRFRQIVSFSNFLMGDILFRKNLFDSTKVFYHEFLETTPTNDYSGIANYRLALCYELTNDRKNSEKYFKQASSGNMDLEDDQFAKRKGEIYSRRSLSENEKNVIAASNLIEAGKYKYAYDSLKLILPNIKTDWLKAETLLYLSDAAFHTNELEESLQFALAAAELDSQDEKWIAPFAVYNAARVYKKRNDIENLNILLDKVNEYDDYDYSTKLKNLLFALNSDLQ